MFELHHTVSYWPSTVLSLQQQQFQTIGVPRVCRHGAVCLFSSVYCTLQAMVLSVLC